MRSWKRRLEENEQGYKDTVQKRNETEERDGERKRGRERERERERERGGDGGGGINARTGPRTQTPYSQPAYFVIRQV